MMHAWLIREPSIRRIAVALAVACCAAPPAGAQLAAAEAELPAALPGLEASPEGWQKVDVGVWRLESADGAIRQHYATGAEGTCTVSVQCDPGGGSVSCTGSPGTCTNGPNWVECDGNRTYCDCFESVLCPGGEVLTCTGPHGTCSSGSDWVECGGNRTECEESPGPGECPSQCQSDDDCLGCGGPGGPQYVCAWWGKCEAI